MSVPKSRRGESPADYLDLAREIYVFTYDRVKILPKSHTFYFSLPLYNAAQRAYRLVKTAKGAFSLREKRRGYPPGLLQEHKAHEGQAKGFPPLGRLRENGERGRRYVRYIVPGAHEEV